VPNPLRIDPTRTITLRRRYMTATRVRIARLRAAVVALVGTEDAFGLTPRTPLAFNARFTFRTDTEKVQDFREWLQREVDAGVLGPPGAVAPWNLEYIESAYKQGAMRAYIDTRAADLASDESFYAGGKAEFLNSAFAAPETTSKIRLLATRAFNDLRGVTDAMGTQMNRQLAAGIAHGTGPREVAREMANSIDTLTRTRALLIARTEIIRAHAEGQLDSFERLGVSKLGLQAEWLAAQDDRVCPRCSAMHGKVLTVEEARDMIPLHPNCRCAWKPHIEVPADLLEEERRRAAGIFDKPKKEATPTEQKNQKAAGATRHAEHLAELGIPLEFDGGVLTKDTIDGILKSRGVAAGWDGLNATGKAKFADSKQAATQLRYLEDPSDLLYATERRRLTPYTGRSDIRAKWSKKPATTIDVGHAAERAETLDTDHAKQLLAEGIKIEFDGGALSRQTIDDILKARGVTDGATGFNDVGQIILDMKTAHLQLESLINPRYLLKPESAEKLTGYLGVRARHRERLNSFDKPQLKRADLHGLTRGPEESEYAFQLRMGDTLKPIIAERAKVLEEAHHGMTYTEKLHSIVVDDVIVQWDDEEAGARDMVAMFLTKQTEVPRRIWNSNEYIVFTKQRNKEDELWAVKYKQPGFVSAATGGDGGIVVYGNRFLDNHTYYHETAHNAAKQVWGSVVPPSQTEFHKLLDVDDTTGRVANAVSTYGKNNTTEAWAEAAAEALSGLTIGGSIVKDPKNPQLQAARRFFKIEEIE